MATIRKFTPKKEVIETEIGGFYIRALSIAESKEIAKEHANLTEEDLQDEKKNEELTMKLFDLACDEKGEKFDEFKSYEEIEKLSVDEFNMFAEAIKGALVPDGSSEKKS